MRQKNQTKLDVNPFIRLDSINAKMVPISSEGGRGWRFIDEEYRITVYPREFLDKYDSIRTNENCRELLIYIMNHLTYDSDKIQLIVDDLSEKLSIPRSTMYDSIDKLEEKQFIKRTGKRNMYWINPYLMFKGNRLSKYPEAISYTGKDTVIAERIKRDMLEAKYPHLKEERRESYE
jgi:hypothetical protein